jgi:hypothetical protein
MTYRHPERPAVYVRGGPEAAAAYAPCVIVDLHQRDDGVVVFEIHESP